MTVSAIVIDSNGCTAYDDILITVEATRDIYTPNVFSPNEDGINDFFFLSSSDPDARIETLQIFDRWGEIVFTAHDIPVNSESEGWNGKFGGERMLPGVYVFSAVISFGDGFKERVKGDITLIR